VSNSTGSTHDQYIWRSDDITEKHLKPWQTRFVEAEAPDPQVQWLPAILAARLIAG
jgi:hypothetical protein